MSSSHDRGLIGGIRADVPVEVLGDTIQPFPTFSGIYDTAVMDLRIGITDMSPLA